MPTPTLQSADRFPNSNYWIATLHSNERHPASSLTPLYLRSLLGVGFAALGDADRLANCLSASPCPPPESRRPLHRAKKKEKGPRNLLIEMPPGLLAHGQNESSPQFSTPPLPMTPVRKRQFWETLGRRLVELAKGSAPRRRSLASCGLRSSVAAESYICSRVRRCMAPPHEGVVVIT